jgi:hypothetical protein
MPNCGIGLGLGLGLRAYKHSSGITYLPGIVQSVYAGYYDDDVNYFSTATRTSSAVVTIISDGSIPETTTYEYIGYFRPTTTESYTFYLECDDAGYLWVGANAVVGFTTSNALINNGGLHGDVEVAGTVNLVAGNYYPIRIQHGNNGGPGSAYVRFSTPTITKTSALGGVVYYNKATNGL